MTFAGTGKLVRFLLRLDRIRLVVWIAGIVWLVWVTAVSVKGLYPTQADLESAAQPMYDNAAVIALNGPTYGIDTMGGQIVFQVGSFGYVVMALMGMFLVGRHTRADEEAGRTELVRATVLGRNAPVTAALVVAVGGVAVVGALISLGMWAQDLSVPGSIAYGAAMAGFGIVFACVTAVTAQVTEHNRASYGMAGALLGGAYIVRAVGDVGTGALSWLSPMGWAQSVRPYADERWWPLGLLAGASIALVAVAYALLSRRDLGGGLVPPRPGPPEASPWLGRPWGLVLRLQRASLLGWTAGLVATGVAYGSVGKDVRDLLGDNADLEEIIAQSGGSLTDSFFATSLLMIALIGAGFAIASVLRLRGEETGGTSEQLLATAMSRWRWVGSHLAMAAGGTVLILAGAGLGMGLAYGLSIDDLSTVPELVGAAVAFAPAVWVLVGVGVALYGLAPRAVAVLWGVLALCFVIGLLGELLDLPQWVIDLSPFQHVPAMPAAEFTALPLVLLTLVAAGLVGLGVAGYERRDTGY
jgi:polyether ionophore transport system permease protein